MKTRFTFILMMVAVMAFAQQTHNVITVKDPSTIPLPNEEKG